MKKWLQAGLAMTIAAWGTAHAAALDDAKAGWAAFQRGADNEAMQLLTQAIDAHQLDPRTTAVVFAYRGDVRMSDGVADQALQDFNAAIELDPRFVTGLTERANAFRVLGQFDRALDDFNTALTVQPDFAPAYRGRGAIEYYQGQYQLALTDFQQALTLQASYTYAAIWLHMAHAKLGQSDEKELAKNAVAIDRQAWPGPVLSLFLGDIQENDLRSAATHGSPRDQRAQACQATFYIAEFELIRKNAGAATQLFRDATSACPPDLYEYTGARAEMNSMGE